MSAVLTKPFCFPFGSLGKTYASKVELTRDFQYKKFHASAKNNEPILVRTVYYRSRSSTHALQHLMKEEKSGGYLAIRNLIAIAIPAFIWINWSVEWCL